MTVRGMVQGVGFRPFVYSLACRLGLSGWVRNSADGVSLEVEGAPETVERFLQLLIEAPPPLAAVEAVSWRPLSPQGERAFRIEASRGGPEHRALVLPDIATCRECLRELFDPGDRRYRYPFTTCTHCGPRFTLIRGVPYDRAHTTMAGFVMCAACQREYEDPTDRRFHAQPNACPECGPQARLLDSAGRGLAEADDAISAAAQLLREGAILAVKGLGGYHLACDPFRAEAVAALRGRKARQEKPFALMVRDLEQARSLCRISAEEAALLEMPSRPIVLLERRRDDGALGAWLQETVAPRQSTLGVMLAYTPLHHLLLHDAGIPLVMTSGNRSDEPIAYRDDEALQQLGGIAEAFLLHDRPIQMRCDDSIARIERLVTHSMPAPPAAPRLTLLRRSRGYAPDPLRVPEPFRRPILACGAELKATFCLGRDGHAFMSHHLGDLESYEAFRSYEEAIAHYCRVFDVRPEAVVCDLHPEYGSTRYAERLAETGPALLRVQHHEAHVASCLADNGRPGDERVIGVAFDGTGFGRDGAIWGGEFFTGSVREGFVRRAHLRYVPLPGGAAAIRHPWRMALAYLRSVNGEAAGWKLPPSLLPQAEEGQVRAIHRMMESGIHCLPTSSAGRLFDAAAALLGLPGTDRATYEGQAAVELELAAGEGDAVPAYPVSLGTDGEMLLLETGGLIEGIVDDLRAGRSRGEIAARFHASLAEGLAACCRRLREAERLDAVALSGGAFQNRLLLGQVKALLTADGFTIYSHCRVPPNDGGLALGQAVLANGMGD